MPIFWRSSAPWRLPFSRRLLRLQSEPMRIAILGGGLAGLSAAFRLCDRHQVRVLEAGDRLGGQIWTELDGGFVVERGAEGFVARSEAVPALARDLGMPEGELIGQSVMRSYGFDGGALSVLLPGEAATLLGFQVPREELGKGIRSLRRGMGSLVWALAGNLEGRAEIALGTRAVAVEAQRGGELAVRTASGETIAADAVIVATSAAAAAPLLEPLAGDAARALHAAPTVSSVTVELAFARDQVAHSLDGTGFVVALAAQEHGLRACTFTSAKFEDRAPPGKISLRVFLRPSDEDLAELDEAAWIERAFTGLTRVVPVSGRPLRSWVSIWPRALPVFDDGHRAGVAALEAAVAPLPVLLAGSAFHGSGIDAAVRSGERAAALLDQR
jgi:protoporphyrinogen/coproporphyrinogen III oxidase